MVMHRENDLPALLAAKSALHPHNAKGERYCAPLIYVLLECVQKIIAHMGCFRRHQSRSQSHGLG